MKSKWKILAYEQQRTTHNIYIVSMLQKNIVILENKQTLLLLIITTFMSRCIAFFFCKFEILSFF